MDIDKITLFADKYLAPYKIKETVNGTEIVPMYCPYCQGGSSSDRYTFALNADKGCFTCKRGSCGATGSVEQLFKMLGESAVGVRKADTKRMSTVQRYVMPKTELHPPTDTIYDYFKRRGISKNTLDMAKIASDKKGNIVFPFYEDNVLTFVKYRHSSFQYQGSKEWRDARTKPILFGMQNCRFDIPLFITEGEIDTLSLYEIGLTNAVSVPSGCEDFSWIEHCYEWLEKFDTIILFGDNDDPGRRMVEELSKRLDESRCRIVRNYPDNLFGSECKDANEILVECGPDVLMKTAESAEEIEIKGLLKLSDVEYIDETTLPRIKTMIPSIDAATSGLMQGGLVVMTGSAGNGKSSLASQIMLSALEQGKYVCAYSGELEASRFLSIANFQAAGSDYITLKYDSVRGKEVPFVPYDVQKRIKEWYGDRFLLADNNALTGTDVGSGIIKIFTMAKKRYNAELFLVDNMMCVTAASESEELKAQQKFVNDLKRFAIKYKVSVILVSHPRKSKTGESIRKDDVSGTAMIVNLADTVIVVNRGSIDVIKNRWTGQLKKIESVFCGDSRRIYEMSCGDKNKFSWDKSGLQPVKIKANSKEEYNIYLPEASQPF